MTVKLCCAASIFKGKEINIEAIITRGQLIFKYRIYSIISRPCSSVALCYKLQQMGFVKKI